MAGMYQHASDWIPGVSTPFSGVIRVADGKFIACQAVAESPEWAEYLAWAEADPANVPDPYLSPAAGGVVLTIAEDEVPVGTMLDSLPLAPEVTVPRMVDVPAVTGTPAVGEVLSITMGNWEGEPTNYYAQWIRVDTLDEVGSGPDYTVTEIDQGHDLACTVTAVNSFGSTRAPLSNAVTIPAPVVAAAGFDDGVTTDTATRVAPPPVAPEPERHTVRAPDPEAENHRRGRHRE